MPCAGAWAADGLVQIPGQCAVEGDIRLIPFYPIADAVAVVEAAVQELTDAQFACVAPPSPSLPSLASHGMLLPCAGNCRRAGPMPSTSRAGWS